MACSFESLAEYFFFFTVFCSLFVESKLLGVYRFFSSYLFLTLSVFLLALEKITTDSPRTTLIGNPEIHFFKAKSRG